MMDLMVISRVENTSINPPVFKILIGCSAQRCYKRTKGGSTARYKGEKKCLGCLNCDLYVLIGDRYEGTPIKKDKYTTSNFNNLHNSIFAGTVTTR